MTNYLCQTEDSDVKETKNQLDFIIQIKANIKDVKHSSIAN